MYEPQRSAKSDLGTALEKRRIWAPPLGPEVYGMWENEQLLPESVIEEVVSSGDNQASVQSGKLTKTFKDIGGFVYHGGFVRDG